MSTKIMGIVNVTPDSFSDNVRLYDVNGVHNMDAILRLIQEMINDGADIIDIGGESTRPGAIEVSSEEEINRVAPVIEAISSRFDIPISLDTYKAKVAEEGLKKGASIINDIGMARKDPRMAELLVHTQCKYVLVDNNKYYANLQSNIDYSSGYFEQLCMAAEELINRGMSRENIVLDPGVGFGKSYEQNLESIRKLPELCKLGYKTLLGVSNKSVIGTTLDLPIDERLEGTLATTAWAVMSGATYVRVHDVKANARLIRMLEAINS